MGDSSSLGVTASSNASSTLQVGYNALFASSATAVNIGTLTGDSSSLNVLSQLSTQAPQDYYQFNFNSGDNIKLAFNNLTDTSNLRVQLYDVAGNVVADSQGTADQQTAYSDLTSSNGLSAGTGTYYVKVSYASTNSTTPNAAQDYNFQLYSGTTYNSTLITSALTQAYDPNLFNSVTSTVTPASNLVLYNRTATLASSASAATATVAGTVTPNGQALNVISKLTSANATQDYNVAANSDGKLKLNFTNSTGTSTLHVKLYDSTGTKVIADSSGTSAQQLAYKELTSGAGLQSAKGNYIVQVGYADGQVKTDQSYNFQVYSGNGYSSFYTTTTVAPTTTSLYNVGSNLDIFAQASATLGTTQQYNSINATAAGALNIGWLQENTSSLAVSARLTQADNADFYSFTFQQGSAIKLSASNSTSKDELHIQLLDASGNYVIADNEGTDDQKKAFASLTSDTGLTAKSSSNYILKVAYGANSDKTLQTDYALQLYAGTKYTAEYKTYASAQTLGNFFLSGGTLGTTPAGNAAALITAGNTTYDVLSALNGG